MEIKNAKIVSTKLGYEYHGIFTCSLQLDYGGVRQSFGGYTLDSYSKELKRRIGSAFGMNFLIGMLKTLDIESWEDLVGQNIRVQCSHTKVDKIGHFLKDQWFDPKELPLDEVGS